METYCICCKKYTANEISSVRKAKQNKLMFYQTVLFVARKNQLLLGIKNSTILITFEMISLKSIKPLTNFIDCRQIYARIAFKVTRIYL